MAMTSPLFPHDVSPTNHYLLQIDISVSDNVPRWEPGENRVDFQNTILINPITFRRVTMLTHHNNITKLVRTTFASWKHMVNGQF